MTPYSTLTTSPQQADPLTWIVSFNLPMVAAVGTMAGGIVITIWASQFGVSPLATLLSTVISALACLLVLQAARPQRPSMRPVQCVAPMALGIVSMMVSAVGHKGGELSPEEWTGPLGICSIMLALVPYCSALTTGMLGLIGAVASASVARWTFPDALGGELALLLAGATLPLHLGIIGAAFSAMVVAAVMRWRALPYDRDESDDQPTAFAGRLQQHGLPLVISDEVVALLAKVADGGRVSAKERTDAAELAADIRADLVTVIDRSWLDSIGEHQRLIVEDPHNAANRMTRQQRAAIHALIRAALDSPVLAGEALRIELRPLEDGTTAVALSMNVHLPEGKRVMLLAPYFVSLKASVHDLEWAGGEQLRMRFKLPAPPDNRGRGRRAPVTGSLPAVSLNDQETDLPAEPS